MTTIASLADVARRELPELQDRIIGPGDGGYDEARAVHNGMIDRHPALIVHARNADDVADSIAFARRHDTRDRGARRRPQWRRPRASSTTAS